MSDKRCLQQYKVENKQKPQIEPNEKFKKNVTYIKLKIVSLSQ